MGYSGLEKHGRRYPADAYKQESYSDEKIHFSITLDPEDHAKLVAQLHSRKINRNRWIQEAVREKLLRES